MPKVRLESDTNRILPPSSPEPPPVSDSTKHTTEDVEMGYTVENFDYRVFSNTTDSIPPKMPSANSNWDRITGTPSVLVQRLLAKIRQINACGNPNRALSGVKMGALLVALFLALFAGIYMAVQWHAARNEAWLRRHQCTSGLCLTAAGILHSNMNKSISPCDNFYRFACGHKSRAYRLSKVPDTPAAQGAHLYRSNFGNEVVMHFNREKWGAFNRIHRPAIDYLAEINVHAIIKGLQKVLMTTGFKQTSAKFKIALWYASCTDRHYLNYFGVKAFMELTLKSIGGLWLFDRQATNSTGAGMANSTVNWPRNLFNSPSVANLVPVPANWSWMQAISRLHADLHVPIFADFRLLRDSKKDLNIHLIPPGAVRLYGQPVSYTSDQITRLLQLLAVESNIPLMDPEITRRIQQAAKDYVTISSALYKLYGRRSPNLQAITLAELNAKGSGFDWKGLLSTYFNQVSFTFTDDYRVYARNVAYMKQISPFLDSLVKNYSQPVLNRMMNNYLLCQTLREFAWHLSYEFAALHARWGVQPDSDSEVDCLLLLHEVFPSVLEAIFIEHHLNAEAMNHTTEMLELLKHSAWEEIERVGWLDEESKRNVRKRIEQMQIKFIAPEYMLDDAKLDYAYRQIKVSYVYIENVVATIQYARGVYNRLLVNIAEPLENDWLTKNSYVYDSKIGIDVVLDALHVPLGVLQPPVYHHTLPAAMNFAGFGSMVGAAVAQLLGILGSFRLTDKYEQLWTEKSWTEYAEHVNCVFDKLRNDTLKLQDYPSWELEMISNYIREEASSVLDDATGVRIASQALARWNLKRNNKLEDSTLPGEHFDQDKLFYISFAQTFCETQDVSLRIFEVYSTGQIVPYELIVNQIMSELPEFSSTFNCPAGVRMNPSNRCRAVL